MNKYYERWNSVKVLLTSSAILKFLQMIWGIVSENMVMTYLWEFSSAQLKREKNGFSDMQIFLSHMKLVLR